MLILFPQIDFLTGSIYVRNTVESYIDIFSSYREEYVHYHRQPNDKPVANF